MVAASSVVVSVAKIPKPKEWYEVSSSNITNGTNGTIFQASNGDLYAMGNDSKLQVLKNNLKFEITSQTSCGTNDGIIKAKNFINYYSQLQYQNELIYLLMVKLQALLQVYTIFNESAKDKAYNDDGLTVNLPDQIIQTFAMVLIDAKIQNVSVLTISTQLSKNRIVKHGVTPNSSDINSPVQNGFSFTFASATPINDIGKSCIYIYSWCWSNNNRYNN